MVEYFHTVLANSTVAGSRRTEYQAGLAESPFVFAVFVADVRHQKMLEFLSLFLEEGFARDDPRVSEAGEKEEDEGENDRERCENREGRGYSIPQR